MLPPIHGWRPSMPFGLCYSFGALFIAHNSKEAKLELIWGRQVSKRRASELAQFPFITFSPDNNESGIGEEATEYRRDGLMCLVQQWRMAPSEAKLNATAALRQAKSWWRDVRQQWQSEAIWCRCAVACSVEHGEHH